MKISNAIAIIALVLQGLLLHTDARLRHLDDEDYPASTSYFRGDSGVDDVEVKFNEEASGFVLESTAKAEEAETGVYLQASSGSSRHGERCRFPAPNCGKYYQCMTRYGRRPICVDNNKCIPARVVLTRQWDESRARRCCNGYMYDRDRREAICL